MLILSEFTGASQSLGAGAILVNPWNITDLSAAIGDALTMTEAERRERHRQNHMHITIHTSQTWAETFISELNDTHVEAELRTKHIPPQVSTLHQHVCCCICTYQVCACMYGHKNIKQRLTISTLHSPLLRCAVLSCAVLCCPVLSCDALWIRPQVKHYCQAKARVQQQRLLTPCSATPYNGQF